jgi:hypothetical protein
MDTALPRETWLRLPKWDGSGRWERRHSREAEIKDNRVIVTNPENGTLADLVLDAGLVNRLIRKVS